LAGLSDVAVLALSLALGLALGYSLRRKRGILKVEKLVLVIILALIFP